MDKLDYFGHRGNVKTCNPKCIYCEDSVKEKQKIIWTDFGLAHQKCF